MRGKAIVLHGNWQDANKYETALGCRGVFVGDICLGMGWPERLRAHGAGHPFAHVRDLLRDVDLNKK